MGTGDASPVTDTGYPRRTGMGRHRDGARVVVRGRESRPHGEGEQGTDRQAVQQERSVDSDHQADKAWLLSVQRKLYQWSRQHLDESYRELWNWIIDPRNLRCAWARVATNQGKRTAGIDGKTVGSIRRDIASTGMVASMSRKGNCWDNAPTESFFNSLKNERVHGTTYATRAHAQADLFDYIEVFYNRKRRHSTLGYCSPVQFLENWISEQTAQQQVA